MKTLRLLHYKPNILPLQVYAHFHGHLIAPAIQHQMISTLKSSLPHVERTAAEPRQNKLYNVQLSHIEQVNPTVRLLRLAIPPNESEGDKSREDEEVYAPILYWWLCDSNPAMYSLLRNNRLHFSPANGLTCTFPPSPKRAGLASPPLPLTRGSCRLQSPQRTTH